MPRQGRSPQPNHSIIQKRRVNIEQGSYLRSPERSLALSVVVEAALNFRGLEALLWQGLWVLSPGSVSGKCF